ncbi:Acetyltransferase (GNAT) domain-containing protein [Pelosinus propionicus DSM 13327]|uniref:Acetyltransferase (GNAT) domain-containing protein n=2 Tax=Pelosinus TaxID=365348 RepID=A0A1I4N875_9FIRM|nr:Acetyltransferase (GNAT) domain-containing protein [Pelosinus propionicus DSM 13327]
MDDFLIYEAYVAHLQRDASTTLVFYDNNLAAYFTLQRNDITILTENSEAIKVQALALARLAVSKQYQCKGIGTFIIERIKEIAYMTNERFIKTDAVFEKWKWYEKRGFQYAIEDEINPETTEGLVYMIMDLYDEELISQYFEE